jgi:hypothetical protein
MENYNFNIRNWKVTLYQDELYGGRKRILTVIGTMIDVFIKIKNVMDSENYNYINIEELK